METPPAFRGSALTRTTRGRCVLLTALVLVSAAPRAIAAPSGASDPINVEIRSSIDDLWNGVHKKKAVPHGKTYVIASLALSPSYDPLASPVDGNALLAQLRATLQNHGYREGDATVKPDIVLTVLYGRGYLKNPYVEYAGASELNGEMVLSVTSPKEAFRRKEIGFEAKAQKAQTEKLFIAVRAWKFPEAAKEKPQPLWQTTMIVADPATNDLNTLAKQMFAAGARFFDHKIDQEEVIVSSSDPEGRVILAPLKVLGEDAPPSPPASDKK